MSAGGQPSDLDRYWARCLEAERALALVRALHLDYKYALDLIHDLDSGALDPDDHPRARELARARTLDRARDRILVRILVRVLVRVRRYGPDSPFYKYMFVTTRILVRVLDSVLGNALAVLAAALAVGRPSHADRQHAAGRIAPSASCLLAAAARLLPDADRARYAEEFRSELGELAGAGAGRWQQMRYALCQLRSAPQLSRALRSPRRRGAVS